MLANDFKQRVSETKWEDFDCPKWYSPEKVPIVLFELSDIPLKEHISKIASDTIYSFGNNHSGAYYRAIVSALPFVAEVAEYSNNANSRNCAWNILIDIYYSFDPDMESIREEIERRELSSFVKNMIEQTVQACISREQEPDVLRMIKDIQSMMAR